MRFALNIRIILVAFIIPLIILSCGSKKSAPLKYNQITQKICKADTTQSYAVYLPSAYTNQKKWPVIYVFDSHGGGQFAVEHFKEAAESFGYVIIGSNNSKNGLQTLDHTIDIMISDANKELSLDNNRQYAAGFSGGGRVASYLAIKSGKIKGVITCGAGLPEFDMKMVTVKFDVYAIAGHEDFNYDEVMAISQLFDRTDWRYIAMSFNGGHEWPSATNIKKAVLWFQLNAMKDGIIAKDNDVIEQEFDSTMLRCKYDVKQNQYIAAVNECKTGLRSFDGLINIKKLRKKLIEIQELDGFHAETQKEAQLKYSEQELRNTYIAGFKQKDLEWWRNDLKTLSDKINNEQDLSTRQMYKRIKGFLGIVCYSYTSNAFKINDEVLAQKSINIYEIVEPQNSDCYYYKALLMDRRNQSDEAVAALKKAIKLGFTDISKAKATISKKVIEAADL